MNQRSLASDPGLAYWLARDLANMNGGRDQYYRRDALATAFQIPLSVQHWSATPTIPAHTVFSAVNTMFLAIGGATLHSQILPYFNAASVRARPNLDFINEAAYDAALTIQAHCNSVIVEPEVQVVFGHSFGGAIAQALALVQPLIPSMARSASCTTFGSPRMWQDFGGPVNTLEWSHARFNNVNDPICFFPPHADEAAVASALTTTQIRHIWQHTEHVGQGFVLDGTTTLGTRMVPRLEDPIADAFLWSWFLSWVDLQRLSHSMETYASRLYAIQQVGSTVEYEPMGAPPVVRRPPTEEPGRLMQPLEARAIVAQTFVDFQVSRGTEPEQNPYYAIRRAGVWQTEYQGHFIAGGRGKRNAKSLASKLNAAWRQWWRANLADTGNLSFSVNEAFPS